MATVAYEGGVGGKSRRRPLRRPSSTPYDRPPSAIRGPRALQVLAAPEKNGWLSKLVDPASRIITRSASRLFSSVFRKRLSAPPTPAEANLHSTQELPAATCANPSLRTQEQGGSDTENQLNNSNANEAKQKTNSDPNGIGELEQLLKQKTFTRVEFDRLTELVRSRTIEPSKALPVVSYEKEKDNVSEQGNEAGCVKLNGNSSNPKPMKEFASPAEFAKAYMGSRPSELPYSPLNLKNQIFRDGPSAASSLSYRKERSDLSVMPRSVVHFSGTPEVTGNGYMTPRLLGRSAMHRMSCSPYFKSPSTTNIKDSETYKDGNFGPSASSQLTTKNSIHSTGKQVNKRRSSVLDGDFVYSGPIRRIRQKSNLMSPSRGIQPSHPGNLLSPSIPFSNDIDHGIATNTQTLLCLDGAKHDISDLKQARNGDSKVLLASVDSICSQSSGMEKKPQQFHDLESPPKKKTSELKSLIRDELPSKLTTNMLHERALKSMKGIDSSRFFNLQGHGNLDPLNDSHVPSCSNSHKLDVIENNTSPKPAVPGVKVISETVGTVNSTTPAIDIKPDSERAKFAVSGSSAVPLPKRPAFQMTAPEEELDDDDFNSSEPFMTGNNKLESKISEYKTVNSGLKVLEKTLASSSESAPASSSVLNGDAHIKASSRLITAKDGDFSFPVASGSETLFQIPLTPTVPSSVVDRSSMQKEQVTCSASAYGSKEIHAYELPTTTSNVSGTAGSGTAGLSKASGATTRPVPEGSSFKEEGKYSEARDLLKSASSSLSSSTSSLIAASGSSVSSLINGSITSTSFIACADRVMPFSNGSEVSVLSTAPLFSMVSSNTSISAPISVSSYKESKSTGFDPNAFKASPFSPSNAIASVPSALLNTDKNSSLRATPSISSSGGASAVEILSIFSSPGSVSSAPSVVSTPSMSNGIFGFTGTVQSINSTLSGSNSTSQNSANFLATAGFSSSTTESQTQVPANQLSSLTSAPTFGLSGLSSSGSGSSFGSATFGSNPFSSSGGVSSPMTSGSSSSASNSSFVPTTASSLFSASLQSSTSPFGSSASSSSTGFSFGQATSTSSSQTSTTIVGSSTSTGFSFGQSAQVSTSQTSASSIFGSTTSSSSAASLFGKSASTSSSQPSTSMFGSSNSSPSTVFAFGESATSTSRPSSGFAFDSGKTSQTIGLSFGLSAPTSSSQASTSPIFGSSSLPITAFSFGQSALTSGNSSSQPSASPTFGASAPLPSTGFSFSQSASTSGGFTFGASSAPPFSFTSAGTANLAAPPSPVPPVFGLTPAVGFGTGSPGNDQMNVEDSMADDSIQAAAPTIPTFGQANSLPTSNFAFDSAGVPSGGSSVFQFGGQQNSSVPQSTPFQASGNLQFSSGGSFSLGTGDKNGRKVVRVNRNKYRKGR